MEFSVSEKYYIKTFGCQMNVYDSSRIADMLKKEGYEETLKQNEADIVLFNTCHIREKAAEKLFSDLGRAHLIQLEREETGKKTIIGVVGCVVQAEDEQIVKRAPFVDFAVGPLMYHTIPDILRRVKKDKKHQCEIKTDFPAISKFDYLPENTAKGACSFLAIQEGCNNFCTYCVVPYTRGAEYSRPIKEVLEEARRLVKTGTLEINLLGQNVNSYHGEDENGQERDLAYLLHKIAEIDGLKRIRYTTSYPADMSDNLIACHKDIEILMPYLHLPVQSGSDRILKAMNRRHNSSDYLRAVEKLKIANPMIGMSSDFIVGFPGETDEDFQKTLDIVNEVKYIQAFSFKYSRRAGTPAAVMDNQVEEKVKKERLDILQTLLFDYQTKFNQNCIGKVMPVLLEQKGRHKGQLIGRTPYMQNLHVETKSDNMNKIINVEVVESTTNSLSGKEISNG
ncbi:MAG: tRNA (N6-isopentenyl adenosine(37)-C2)-methylthiotransferase MiaB [Alphaproteobacteria bacterium]|nr:tRNA (N6-isopentenyl adenosine(37)-C2)-methylthiotransferase MiaB [Alphaproteobacteria bacterium]